MRHLVDRSDGTARIPADALEQGIDTPRPRLRSRREDPLPDHAGDDERDRHGKQVDRPKNSFALDLLIEQDSQYQSKNKAKEEKENGKEESV